MASRNHKQKIEKALHYIEGISYALSNRKAAGMTAADADAAARRMADAEVALRAALSLYEDAERRRSLRAGKEADVHTDNPDAPDNG